MNLILQAIKSSFRKLENKIDKDIINNRSDWEQDDENGVGYIKNRPFYCKEDAMIDILPVGNYYTQEVEGMLYECSGQLIEGAEYIVTFNELTETRLAITQSDGKIALQSSNNTDLRVRNYNDSTIEFFSYDSYGDRTHRLGLIGIIDEIKQIDEKYIPNSLIENIEKTQTMMADKMNANNPVGTGSFSMGRAIDSEIGKNSHAEGYNTTASGQYSHAEGSGTTASRENSHAEGFDTTASGKYSHAEGYSTTASQIYSHAEGNQTTASGNNSHAEGFDTIASGYIAHAEGEKNIASGRLSHAEGYRTTASGNSSHAEGRSTIAARDYQHVQGIYNLEDNLYRLNTKIRNDVSLGKTNTYKNIVFDPNSGAITASESTGTLSDSNISSHIGHYTKVENKYCKIIGVGSSNGSNINYRPFADIEEYTVVIGEYIHIVGNGTSDTSRSNAHTLDWEGNAWYQGDVYVGSTSGTNKDEGSKKLATEDYVDSKITEIDTALLSIIGSGEVTS